MAKILPDILRHILESGVSDEPMVVDEEGIATGGWADAFPKKEDIQGLSFMDTHGVMDMHFNIEEGSPN